MAYIYIYVLKQIHNIKSDRNAFWKNLNELFSCKILLTCATCFKNMKIIYYYYCCYCHLF